MTARDSYAFQQRLQRDLRNRLELPRQSSRADWLIFAYAVAVLLWVLS